MQYSRKIKSVLIASSIFVSFYAQAAGQEAYIPPPGAEYIDISIIAKKVTLSKGRVLVHISTYDPGCPTNCTSLTEQHFVKFAERNKGKLKIWVTSGEYDLSRSGQQTVQVRGPFAKMVGLDENNKYAPAINYLFIDGKLVKNIEGKILADGLEKAVFSSRL